MSEIIFEHVYKLFGDEIILEDLNLRIEKGEFVFVVGKSGAGKSTLLNLLIRQQEATKGKIIVNGRDLSGMKEGLIPYHRRKIGFMSPNLGLLKDRTVYENIRVARLAAGVHSRNEKKEIIRILGLVGMAEKYRSKPKELSGGEEARVLLARAISVNPEILVADEPTANLDADAAWDLMLLFQEFNRRGMTVVAASHSRELVTVMKKRVITLVAGCIVSDEKQGVYDMKAMDIFEERKVLERRKEKKDKNLNFLS